MDYWIIFLEIYSLSANLDVEKLLPPITDLLIATLNPHWANLINTFMKVKIIGE